MFLKIIISLIMVSGGLCGLLFTGSAAAADYYMSANGNDRGTGTVTSPWKTFARTTKNLRPGDTVLVKDGVYFESLNLKASGTKKHHITIKAMNDGMVTVDGQASVRPLEIHGQYINIEGMVFRNSNGHVIGIYKSGNINLRRVSAYDAAPGNFHPVLVLASSDVLLEDCIAGGQGRLLFCVNESSYIKLRRCIALAEHAAEAGVGITLYHADNSTVENCIVRRRDKGSQTFHGITINSNTSNMGHNNSLFGNIIEGNPTGNSFVFGLAITSRTNYYQLAGNSIVNNVVLDSYNPYGNFFNIKIESDSNLRVENNTVGFTGARKSYNLDLQHFDEKADRTLIRGTLKNNSIFGGHYGVVKGNGTMVTGKYNNYWANNHKYGNRGSDVSGEQAGDPGYETRRYGRGAYLMVPPALRGKGERGSDIGASVLYRYRDGVITAEALWPWPMEDRLVSEKGISVTWEARGGLWKTLQGVYEKKSGTKSPGMKFMEKKYAGI